jgi:hypothetical protein
MRFVGLSHRPVRRDYCAIAVCRNPAFEPTAETRRLLKGLSLQVPGVGRRNRVLGGKKVLEAKPNPSVRSLPRIRQRLRAELQDQDLFYPQTSEGLIKFNLRKPTP